MVDIILVMIVKNEGKIIQRCLDCAKPIISGFSICDTGSTDNTVELINEWSTKNNIKGNVVVRPWKNFGHNRSESFDVAKEYILSQGYNPSTTYAIFLDADMKLVVKPEFKKSLLSLEGYSLMQFHGFLEYYNLRLARFDLSWKCVGVTHEFWSCGKYINDSIKELVIDDQEDGGAKADKFTRDERLLLEGLKDEPDNERYLFYLAQTYFCLGKWEESIKWYKKRIEKGGWYEEVWYSHYKIVENYIKLDESEMAIEYTLKAYAYYPKRSETFKILAEHLRDKKLLQTAYHFASMGEPIPHPSNDKLFISKDTYDFKLTELKSWMAYYVGKTDEGLVAIEKLFSSANTPMYVKQLALNNLNFYVGKIKVKSQRDIKIDKPNNILVTWINHHDRISILYKDNNQIYEYKGLINEKLISSVKEFPDLTIHDSSDISSIYFKTTGNTFTPQAILNKNGEYSVPSIITSKSNIYPVYTAINKKSEQLECKKFITTSLKLLDSPNNIIDIKSNSLFQCLVTSNSIEYKLGKNNGYLMLIVQVNPNDTKKRFHRFYWSNGNAHKVSPPFVFNSKDDEVVHSLNRVGESLYAVASIDKSVSVFEFELNQIESLLK